MGRPIAKGFDYIPLDTAFFSDIKIRKIQKRAGACAPIVYLAILCEIYRNGYYLDYDDDTCFLISETSKVSEEEVSTIIASCLEVGLFSQSMFDSDKVLTSEGIQRRYQQICTESKRKSGIVKHSLLDISSEETIVNSEETPISSEETPVNSELSAQRKEKESKGNKSKEKEISSSLSSSNESDKSEGIKIEQEEKKEILKIFFANNIKNPVKEVERFIAYNSSRCWRGSSGFVMSTQDQRLAAAKLWKSEKDEKELPDALYNFITPVYVAACQRCRGDDIVPDQLLPGTTKVTYDKNGNIQFITTKGVQDWMEANSEQLRNFLPKNKKLTYLINKTI